MRALEPNTQGSEERARTPLWIARAEFRAALEGAQDPRALGAGVWAVCEPWIGATAALAQDPSVLLDEICDWMMLLERHSALSVEQSGQGGGGDTEVCFRNAPDAPPYAAECEFRLGAIAGLLQMCSGGEPVVVAHSECAAAGGETCRFVVDDWIPCRDARHARAFREAGLLAAQLEGDERSSLRRLASEATPGSDLTGLQRIRRFMDELEDIILIFNQNLLLLDANRAALRFSGMSLDEIRGLSAQDLMSPTSYQAVRATLPMLKEVGALRGMQLEARTRDGWATIEVSARVSASGKTIVCIARDVTARLRLERELAERNLQLRQQNERIADADRLKSEFLANVSHELTTPLTCIKGFARLLLRDFVAEREGGSARLADEQREDFLAIMQRESDRMTHMIQGLLELSNIESGGVSLERVEVSANAIASDCIQLLKPRLDEAGLVVETRLDPDLPRARLDPDRMKQVVLNLLENAIKFSPSGSRIEVLTSWSRDALRLCVRNPTRELEPGDLERIFARFVQRDGSFTRKQGGVGLGLNLVRAIVELHGGKVWAELPAPDQVEFIAELPLPD